MRITAGQYKGKLIESRREEHIKPTSSRVREAVFNLLRHGKFLPEIPWLNSENPSLIEGRVIADVFCGTGILGFEALSRGASKIVFIDQNEISLQVTRKNADNLKVTPQCMFVRGNAVALPKAAIPVDVVLMDPPYKKSLIAPTLQSLDKNGWLRDGALISVEHSSHESFDAPEKFTKLDERDYNNSAITFLIYNKPTL